MTDLNRDKIILRIVNRFLQWRLPENFQPDAGINFTPDFNVNTPWPMKHKPTGTNLFDATQAAAMVEAIAGEELDSLRVQLDDADQAIYVRNAALTALETQLTNVENQLAEREGIARELAGALTNAADDIERYVVARGSEVEASPEECTALYRAVLARFRAAEDKSHDA